jgi:glycopeptide antibiotics resistance protein
MRSRWRAILFTILSGAGLSFAIEVLQFYIPQRGSGITDIITNTLGAALGALLARPRIVLAIFGKTDSTRTNLSNGGLPASIVTQRIAIKPQPRH